MDRDDVVLHVVHSIYNILGMQIVKIVGYCISARNIVWFLVTIIHPWPVAKCRIQWKVYKQAEVEEIRLAGPRSYKALCAVGAAASTLGPSETDVHYECKCVKVVYKLTVFH